MSDDKRVTRAAARRAAEAEAAQHEAEPRLLSPEDLSNGSSGRRSPAQGEG